MTTSMNPNEVFVLIVTNTSKEAEIYEQRLSKEKRNFHIKAVRAGKNIRGMRPTIIVEKYEMKNKKIYDWRNEQLLPAGNGNAVII